METRYTVETKTYDKSGTLTLTEAAATSDFEKAIEYYDLQKQRAAAQDLTKTMTIWEYSAAGKHAFATETINPTMIIKGN